LTSSILMVIVATIVSFSFWAASREYMMNRKWHYHL
jgi:hypothetical protein